jgi:hypothetical protein
MYGPSQPLTTRRTNPWAIGALACGILSLGFGPIASVPAVIVGRKAVRQIRRTGAGGYGFAMTGLVLGYVFLALFVLALFVLVVSRVERGI